MTEHDRISEHHAAEQLESGEGFDERKFLRRVRTKSVLRAAVVSLLVVLVLSGAALGGAYLWLRGTVAQAARIDSYYPDLVAISHPNTRELGPSVTHIHYPGASNDYASYRMVGSRPVAAGILGVDFDVWEAEFLRGYDERWTVMSRRFFRGSDLVPELHFLHPHTPSEDQNDIGPSLRAAAELSFARETAESLRRLAATPPSYTAEVAVSFDRFLSLADLESLASKDTTLAWGAVEVWDPQSAPLTPPVSAGQIVGVPFVTPEWVFGSMVSDTHQQAETNTLATLRRISQRSRIGTARATGTSATYLEENGFRYYGAVLTGPPGVMLRIARDRRVTAVSYGLAVAPWE